MKHTWQPYPLRLPAFGAAAVLMGSINGDVCTKFDDGKLPMSWRFHSLDPRIIYRLTRRIAAPESFTCETITIAPMVSLALLVISRSALPEMAPAELIIGSPRGILIENRPFLQLPVAIKTPIRIVFSNTKPDRLPAPTGDLPISTTTEINREAKLQLVGDASIATCTLAIDSAAQTFWKSHKYSDVGFSLGPTELWESTGKRFVFVLPIRKNGEKEDFIRLAIWGKPRIIKETTSPNAAQADDRLNSLVVEDMDWTEESGNQFVKILAWLAHDELKHILQEQAKISLASVESQIQAHSQIVHDQGNVKVAFNLKRHHVTEFGITGGYLRVVLEATGEPFLTFK